MTIDCDYWYISIIMDKSKRLDINLIYNFLCKRIVSWNWRMTEEVIRRKKVSNIRANLIVLDRARVLVVGMMILNN